MSRVSSDLQSARLRRVLFKDGGIGAGEEPKLAAKRHTAQRARRHCWRGGDASRRRYQVDAESVYPAVDTEDRIVAFHRLEGKRRERPAYLIH